jgi:outer membrane PBP1 activator LpoA protein
MSIFRTPPSRGNLTRNCVAAAIVALTLGAAPAFAGQSEATTAVGRADAKIEMVTRQAGQAGDAGDQTFNMARERLVNARAAEKSNNFDRAEMLANEAALLADLTAEKATLAALTISHDNLVRSSAVGAVAQ